MQFKDNIKQTDLKYLTVRIANLDILELELDGTYTK
jgi:hypothetical protein